MPQFLWPCLVTPASLSTRSIPQVLVQGIIIRYTPVGQELDREGWMCGLGMEGVSGWGVYRCGLMCEVGIWDWEYIHIYISLDLWKRTPENAVSKDNCGVLTGFLVKFYIQECTEHIWYLTGNVAPVWGWLSNTVACTVEEFWHWKGATFNLCFFLHLVDPWFKIKLELGQKCLFWL